MTKLRDIAESCGVSVSTVSLAMHKPHRISRAKKDEILRKAQELGYFSKNKTITRILLICNDFFRTYTGEYYNRAIYGILEVLHQENIVLQILENFDTPYEQVYENNGIIFVGKVPPEYLDKALDFKLPFILCGHPDDQYKYPAVHFDIRRGASELLEYLLSSGHKKIGLIIGSVGGDADFFYKTITGAFREALKRSQLNNADKLLEECSYNNLQTVEIALNKLLKQNPSAIYCSDDHIAYVAYQILKRWGLKIPDDISIVGFDGIVTPPYLPAPKPALTTVYVDPILLGRTAVAQLKKIILNPQNAGPKHLVLPVSLRIGESVKRKR
ncbi:MAG: LacI family transcriptional regulator [Candidatus Margulisbacteria bacterium]|jgi:DNA-binding LacI/PurR family transcriptional regulator|nr:LacI family transcriptional regulator [Candidatus Margulisiibacteriota bacterium]